MYRDYISTLLRRVPEATIFPKMPLSFIKVLLTGTEFEVRFNCRAELSGIADVAQT
jgi:hypothetical protein